VSDGGVINKNNSGNMTVTAQTVYLGGENVIKGTGGAIEFNATTSAEINNTARLPRYFKMVESTMTNVGSVTISDYYLNLDPSGISSDTAITLNIYNSADIAYPAVLIGAGTSGSRALGKNFLNGPSSDKIQINNRTSLNPNDNNNVQVTIPIIARSDTMPELPKSPCDSRNQSTLSAKGVANYIPEASAQVPYSVLAMTTGATSSASAGQAPLLALAMSGESAEC